MPFQINNRHYFPGSNTPLGFYSYYDNIIDTNSANKIFIIKGGPGTGKSTFMNTIADHFKSLDIEYYHCSSDPKSLDAIVIIPAKVAIIDGTFPHSIDPISPGIIDEIINFSPFWDEKLLRLKRNEILEANAHKKSFYKRAYCFLSAAKSANDAHCNTLKQFVNNNTLEDIYKDILSTIFESLPATDTKARNRKLFSSAITPDGFVNYLDSILPNNKLYIIKDGYGVAGNHIMDEIKDRFISMGYDIQSYYSPLDPSHIDDIVVPSLNIAVSLSNKFHKTNIDSNYTFDLTSAINTSKAQAISEEIQLESSLIDSLFDHTFSIFEDSRTAHSKLESYYIPCVNFKLVDQVLKDVLSQIESFL